MTPQVQRAVERLRAAGFARREFSVRVERIRRRVDGRVFYEFGDAKISMRCQHAKVIEQTPQLLAQNFGVTHYVDEAGAVRAAYVHDEMGKRGKLSRVNFTKST